MKFPHAVKYNGVYYQPNVEIAEEAPTAETTASAKETSEEQVAPEKEKTAPKATKSRAKEK